MFVSFSCTISVVFIRAFPRFACSCVVFVVSEGRDFEEKVQKTLGEKARQVTFPLSMHVDPIYKFSSVQLCILFCECHVGWIPIHLCYYAPCIDDPTLINHG